MFDSEFLRTGSPSVSTTRRSSNKTGNRANQDYSNRTGDLDNTNTVLRRPRIVNDEKKDQAQNEVDDTNKEEENRGHVSWTNDDINSHVTSLSIVDFIKLNQPWILLDNDGSFNGYFDWVPKYQRVGPWSKGAMPFLFCLCLGLVYTRPSLQDQLLSTRASYVDEKVDCTSTNDNSIKSCELHISHYPNLHSFYGYYNAVVTCWMIFVLRRNIKQEGWMVPYTTFSVWGWTMLLMRHVCTFVLSTILLLQQTYHRTSSSFISHPATFVMYNTCHFLSETLRGPALLNAFVVTLLWNFVIAPGIYFGNMDTPEKKYKFLKWLCQFNLVNQHGLNLPFAIKNCLHVNSHTPLSANVDLWCGLVSLTCYLLFYVLILDRLGVHLYPLFSPRNKFCVIVWTMVLLSYCGLFQMIQWRTSSWS